MDIAQRPFDCDYVVATTVRHMLKSVDISIRKTMDRIPEFVNDQTKSQEVFRTLTALHGIKKDLEQSQAQHQAHSDI